VTDRKSEKERQLAGGRGWGRGAESYNRKKTWPSVNHLILSGHAYPLLKISISYYCTSTFPDIVFDAAKLSPKIYHI
jgi:hypothetical protein